MAVVSPSERRADAGPAVRLYEAMARGDVPEVLASLHPEFRGFASAGMPLGVGGRHDGRERMLLDCWAVVFGAYDIAPRPDEILVMPDGRLVALGEYRGTERATAREVRAVFAHILRVRDGLVSELRQITDTAAWTHDVDPPAETASPAADQAGAR
jgi:ketosteroid isomerase-like protein